ncbi:unnamed protein product [Tuber melanosporum]|uniref:(Perigord truffle) hypothetical protein n=1 Tax=Tuber melanosporum (strain Mel28) TaxID=656061 RepID=D5GFS4_TUBMM|nr:uncharacterized protein GSTUM_00007050001 [Tuber melanosporum]CAZ83367.1 unnamed protein product [Tuber melanosporum]
MFFCGLRRGNGLGKFTEHGVEPTEFVGISGYYYSLNSPLEKFTGKRFNKLLGV